MYCCCTLDTSDISHPSASSASIQSSSQTDRHPVGRSVSKSAIEPPSQAVSQTPSQSVSQSAVWAGWRLVDGLFVWAEKSQTQQWPAPAPHNGSPHKGPHSGTMGWAESGGGRLSWGYPPAHFRTPPPPLHTRSPTQPVLKSCCRCLPVCCAMRRKQGGIVQWKH